MAKRYRIQIDKGTGTNLIKDAGSMDPAPDGSYSIDISYREDAWGGDGLLKNRPFKIRVVESGRAESERMSRWKDMMMVPEIYELVFEEVKMDNDTAILSIKWKDEKKEEHFRTNYVVEATSTTGAVTILYRGKENEITVNTLTKEVNTTSGPADPAEDALDEGEEYKLRITDEEYHPNNVKGQGRQSRDATFRILAETVLAVLSVPEKMEGEESMPHYLPEGKTVYITISLPKTKLSVIGTYDRLTPVIKLKEPGKFELNCEDVDEAVTTHIDIKEVGETEYKNIAHDDYNKKVELKNNYMIRLGPYEVLFLEQTMIKIRQDGTPELQTLILRPEGTAPPTPAAPAPAPAPPAPAPPPVGAPPAEPDLDEIEDDLPPEEE